MVPAPAARENLPSLNNPGKGTFADRALGDPESRLARLLSRHRTRRLRARVPSPPPRADRFTTVGVAFLQMAPPYFITLNKVLIRDLDFDYAAFVSLLGFTATLLCALVGSRGRFQPAKDAWRRYPGAIVAAAAGSNSSAFWPGNALYETTLSLAFIQVIRAANFVIVLAIGVLVGAERVDSRVAVAVGFVVIGLVIAEGEMNAEPSAWCWCSRGLPPRVSDWRAPSSSCTACDSCSTASSSCSHHPSSRSPPHSSPRSTKT